jgi:hypothetical protein
MRFVGLISQLLHPRVDNTTEKQLRLGTLQRLFNFLAA